MLICCLHAKHWETICPLPFRHLLVQIQQMKHQNNVWNQFLINNKDIRLTLLMSFWCFHCQFWASKSQLDGFPHRPQGVVETGINLSVWSPLRTVNETYGRCLIFTAFDYVFCTTSKSNYFVKLLQTPWLVCMYQTFAFWFQVFATETRTNEKYRTSCNITVFIEYKNTYDFATRTSSSLNINSISITCLSTWTLLVVAISRMIL